MTFSANVFKFYSPQGSAIASFLLKKETENLSAYTNRSVKALTKNELEYRISIVKDVRPQSGRRCQFDQNN